MDAADDPHARIEALEAALQEEEGKLMQAAMFGKSLLSKNQELDALVAQLREENQLILQRAEAEKRELQTLNDRISAQLKEARQSNDLFALVAEENGEEDLKRKDEELSRLTMAVKGGASSQSELVALQKSYADLQERLEKLTESEKQALLSATNATKVFEAEKKAWQDQMKQLKAQNEAAGQQANASAVVKSSMNDLARELEAVKAQNAELLSEKHSMEEAVTSLVRQTQELRHENEEQVAFLTQAREMIGNLKKERDAALTSSTAESAPSSLLDELEANMDKKIQQQEQRPARVVRADAGDGAPENCEEYFLIAQTAVKIGLAMKYPHKSDEVFRVRGIDLYYKCLNSHVPFHQWHLWISRTLHAMLKGEVKPAAIMESSRKAKEEGSSNAVATAEAPKTKSTTKGWIASLFN